MSPDVSALLRRLLRSRQSGALQSSDVEELLNTAAGEAGRDRDEEEGGPTKSRPGEKRADARRCFYHAVNCW